MNNLEMNRERILKGMERGDMACKLFEIRNCMREDCERYDCAICQRHSIEWLLEEADVGVDWSSVPTDTPVLVSNDGKIWLKRHFARYTEGTCFIYAAGMTSFTASMFDSDMVLPAKYIKLAEVE